MQKQERNTKLYLMIGMIAFLLTSSYAILPFLRDLSIGIQSAFKNLFASEKN